MKLCTNSLLKQVNDKIQKKMKKVIQFEFNRTNSFESEAMLLTR